MLGCLGCILPAPVAARKPPPRVPRLPLPLPCPGAPAAAYAAEPPSRLKACDADAAPEGSAPEACDDWRSVGVLCVCWALNVAPVTAAIASITLVGRLFSPGPAAETLPVACVFLFQGAAQATLPLEFRRLGQRRSFIFGAVTGVAGCMLVALAAWVELFSLVCAGGCLQGAALAHAMSYRFAAVSLAPSRPPAAISLLLSGGVAGSILGTGVFTRAKQLLQANYAGIYVLSAGSHLLAGVLLCFVRFPGSGPGDAAAGKASSQATGEQRRSREIFAQPRCWAATFAISAAYSMMMFTMAPTPIVMRVVYGHPFDWTTMVMMGHMVSMYAPSFVTGSLVSRFGSTRALVAGCAVFVLSAASLLASGSLAAFFVGLCLLGLGWNLLFVAGTAQLASCYRPAEGPKIQAVCDALLALSSASSSLISAPLVDGIGWGWTQVVIIAASLVTCAVVVTGSALGAAAAHVSPQDGPK